MGLPGMPGTTAGWHQKINRDEWEYQLRGGRGGKAGGTREYAPPPSIMALIEAKERGVTLGDVIAGRTAQRLAQGFELMHASASLKNTSATPPLLPASNADEGDYVSIPLYDIQASAGHGALVDAEQVVDFLHFKQDWIRAELRAKPADLYLICVDGESMEPTLRTGDIILIDHRDQGVARDGIYVMRMDGALLVKRLQRKPGGLLRVSSDNQAYEPFDISLGNERDDLAVVGRVVWSGRRM